MATTHNINLGSSKRSFSVHEGALHRALGIPEGQKIGQERMRAATHSSNSNVRHMAASGIGLTHMHHGGKKPKVSKKHGGNVFDEE